MKSIKTKGMIFALSLIMFSVLVLGFSMYFQFHRILVDEINNAVERVAKESADHLDNYIEHFVSPLVGLSEDESIKSMDIEKQIEVINSQVNPTYLNIAVVDRSGIAHYSDGSILDLSDREYIARAFEGKIAFSDVIVSRKVFEPVIMVAVPINNNDTIVGVLIARLDVDFLSNFALTRGYEEDGRAYIISAKGSIISRSKQEIDTEEYDIYELVKTNDKYQSFVDFFQESIGKQSGFGSYGLEDKNILMGYASVESTDWKIYIGTSEDVALQSLIGLRDTILPLIAFTLLVCIIAAGSFISRFSNSIKELDDLFSQGAKGNLTIRFTPKSKDEIGRVGLSFNRMMDKIKTLTQYDPLTALLNQYVLEREIESFLYSGEKKQFSLIMIAIDKFGFINETYGYTAGDAILKEAARRIIRCCAGDDQVYRYKGDQFVVLCPKAMSEEEVDILSKDILSNLRENYKVNDKALDININMGTFTRNDDTGTEEPIKAVTYAKNYAKSLGSNQVQKFNRQVYENLQGMNELQADIVMGLKENQFFLVYQPLFYLGDENIAEVEALIRWRHPQRGLLYPDQFIELAEQSGSIKNIDQWVIDTACKQLKHWKDCNKNPIVLSINISATSFETDGFITGILQTIHKYDIDPTLLQLEITERMLIKNVDESIKKLQQLRSMGVHVAIDDFGIGYSSLSYIVRLPVDSIKIDKSFVQNISSSKEAETIVSTIINLCKTLKLKVIAEGIESRFELEYLKSNKCDIGQGYYFSKPVSIVEIESKHLR